MRRLKGTLIEWQDDRGFGFIEPAGGGEKIFCHVKAFAVRVRRPEAGDGVSFVTKKDAHGRIQAADVQPIGLEQAAYTSNAKRCAPISAAKQEKTRPTSSAAAYVFIAAFAVVLAVLLIRGLVSPLVPAIYVVVSLLTIFAYAFDKSAAMNDRWRTEEQTLHVLETLGGWPGALIAQRLFRHKTNKTSYQVAFWLCVFVNLAALALCATQAIDLPVWLRP
jgi:uncharacterized membrane protein YsdA (DUF1294 family)/cold shock CspA family protein